jgi:hypothetical protein
MYRKIAGITYFPAFFLWICEHVIASNNDHSEAVQKLKIYTSPKICLHYDVWILNDLIVCNASAL